MSQNVLILLDLSKSFKIHCDACSDFLGSILLQDGHTIAYESCRLHEQERVLGIYEKELLSMIHALSLWKHYLISNLFIIQTNHQSIRYFMTQTKL